MVDWEGSVMVTYGVKAGEGPGPEGPQAGGGGGKFRARS